MTETSHEPVRSDLLIRAAFQVLADDGGRLPRAKVLAHVKDRVELTPYEAAFAKDGDATRLGAFAWAINIPLIIGLLFTPVLVKLYGQMYRLNIWGYVVAVLGRLGVVAGGYMGSIPLMIASSAIASLGMSPCKALSMR